MAESAVTGYARTATVVTGIVSLGLARGLSHRDHTPTVRYRAKASWH